MLTFYLSMLSDESEKNLFEEIYTSYHDEMIKYACSLHDNLYDAEDLVHEAFLKIIMNISKFHPSVCHNPHGLIVIIVRNIFRNKMKHEKVLTFVPYEEWNAGAEFETLDDIIVNKESYQELLDMIDKLGSDYSDVMVLRFVHEFSYKEISDILDVSQEVARARVSRGREKLRNLSLREGELNGR